MLASAEAKKPSKQRGKDPSQMTPFERREEETKRENELIKLIITKRIKKGRPKDKTFKDPTIFYTNITSVEDFNEFKTVVGFSGVELFNNGRMSMIDEFVFKAVVSGERLKLEGTDKVKQLEKKANGRAKKGKKAKGSKQRRLNFSSASPLRHLMALFGCLMIILT